MSFTKLLGLYLGLLLSTSVAHAIKPPPTIDCVRLLEIEATPEVSVQNLLQTTLERATEIVLKFTQETLGSESPEERELAPFPTALYPHLVMGAYLMEHPAFSRGPSFIELLMIRISLQSREILGRLPVAIQYVRLREVDMALTEVSGRAYSRFYETLEHQVGDKIWLLVTYDYSRPLSPETHVLLEVFANSRREALQFAREEKKRYPQANIVIDDVQTLRAMNNRGQRLVFLGVDFTTILSWKK